MTTKGISKVYAEALQSIIKQIRKPSIKEILEESAELAGLEYNGPSKMDEIRTSETI